MRKQTAGCDNYDSNLATSTICCEDLRFWLRKHHVRPVIPPRRDQRRQPAFSPRRYRRRNVVERAVGLLEQARRVAPRYEKLVVHFFGVRKLAMLQVTMPATSSITP